MVATTPLTYNAYVTQIGVLAVAQTHTSGGVTHGVDDSFTSLIPQMLNYAELRIQRDLDLLPSLTSGAYALTAGSNVFSIPVADFVTLQTFQLDGGSGLVALLPVSKEFLQVMYGDPSFLSQPVYFAPYGGDQATAGATSTNFLIGPYPDQNYPMTVTGTMRLPSLALNATQALASTALTFISTWLPDLLVQASMIYITEYQRNFGPASNDPQMGVTYEQQYQTLLKGALVEEARKRFGASAWSSMSPPTLATPTR